MARTQEPTGADEEQEGLREEILKEVISDKRVNQMLEMPVYKERIRSIFSDFDMKLGKTAAIGDADYFIERGICRKSPRIIFDGYKFYYDR